MISRRNYLVVNDRHKLGKVVCKFVMIDLPYAAFDGSEIRDDKRKIR
jgi:hypothetical protein